MEPDIVKCHSCGGEFTLPFIYLTNLDDMIFTCENCVGDVYCLCGAHLTVMVDEGHAIMRHYGCGTKAYTHPNAKTRVEPSTDCVLTIRDGVEKDEIDPKTAFLWVVSKETE